MIKRRANPYLEDQGNEPWQEKQCSFCKGPFDKGVEIVLLTGGLYQGTFCSDECKLGFKKKREED